MKGLRRVIVDYDLFGMPVYAPAPPPTVAAPAVAPAPQEKDMLGRSSFGAALESLPDDFFSGAATSTAAAADYGDDASVLGGGGSVLGGGGSIAGGGGADDDEAAEPLELQPTLGARASGASSPKEKGNLRGKKRVALAFCTRRTTSERSLFVSRASWRVAHRLVSRRALFAPPNVSLYIGSRTYSSDLETYEVQFESEVKKRGVQRFQDFLNRFL